MGLGIGKDCKICGEQLNYEAGFNVDETLCDKCANIIPRVLYYLQTKDKPNEE